MGMISKGMISKLNKQAEEALKPKEEAVSITADEARKIMQEVLTSKAILEAAHSFVEECYPVIKERAQNGYNSVFVSTVKYDYTNPKHQEIIEQIKKILKEKGYKVYKDIWEDTLVIEW